MASLRAPSVPLCLVTAVAATLALAQSQVEAATYVWGGSSADWTSGSSWQGGVAPSGTNATDVLTFGGDTTVPYSSRNNASSPFLVNKLLFQATGTGAHLFQENPGSSIALGGTNPQIEQNGTGGATINTPIQLRGNTTFSGNGSGAVTLNGPVSGAFDITKTGDSTFRFGSVGGDTVPSSNTWFGALNLQGGTVRFNNNASTGRTALRANPVVTSANTLLTTTSELRVGTLSGAGNVTTTPDGTNADSSSIVITALQDGTFSGTIAIAPPAGTGKADGSLIVRGIGTQRFTGPMTLSGGDVVVGRGATVILSDNARLNTETKGGVTLAGGTFILDNFSGANSGDRLRGTTLDTDSTGVETIGGGAFTLIGGASGTAERVARLQLGSVNNNNTVSTARSGALNINIVHNAGTSGATTLSFASYTRSGINPSPNGSDRQYATVNFTAQNGSGTTLALGLTGSNPRVLFNGSNFTVPLSVTGGHGLLNATGGATDAGWATVNGSDFASYDATNGIVPATATSLGTTVAIAGSATTNYMVGNATTLGLAFNAQTIKLAPTAGPGSLTINANLTSRGFILGGVHDFTISSNNGTNALIGSDTRYFYVNQAMLTVSARVGGSGALVKSGAGRLNLTADNSAQTFPLVINEGLVQSKISNLTGGELRLRGGVLELKDGGTFNRPVGIGNGSVNWAGFDGLSQVNQDRGSGGFAAVGQDVILDLGGASQTSFTWEGNSFVNSGHALIFGSRAADRKVNWVDNLNLTAAGTVNYNAREFRVIDHADPAVLTDRLQVSGTISGSIYNDLLKTGDGVLELSGSNSYLGATVVHEGTLLVNGQNSESFVTQVKSGAKLGGIGSVRTAKIEAGGILAPGELTGANQAGKLTVNGDLMFASALSKFKIEIDVASNDSVEVIGGVTLNGAQLEGSLLNGFVAENKLVFLIINDGTDAVQGTFGSFAQGSLVNIGGQGFEISYIGDSVAGTFTGGNDVVLRAIPEPATGLLIGTSALLLGGMRRFRRSGFKA